MDTKRKPGRPRVMNAGSTITTSVVVDVTLYGLLEEHAASLGASRSQIIRDALDYYAESRGLFKTDEDEDAQGRELYEKFQEVERRRNGQV